MKRFDIVPIKLLFIIHIIFVFAINAQAAVSGGGSVVYYADPSQPDQGVTGNGMTIKAIVDAIGPDTNATIKIRDLNADGWTDYNFSTDETITDNITLDIEKGARLVDGGGNANLIINGSVKAGSYQIFKWTGTGAIKGLKYNNLCWFGGPANNSGTDFKAAMGKAIAATAEKGTLLIPSFGTTYYEYGNSGGLSDATTISKTITIKLDGIIKSTDSTYQSKPSFVFNITGDYVTIEGTGTFKGPGTFDTTNGAAGKCPGFIRTDGGDNFKLDGITFLDGPQMSLYMIRSNNGSILNCNFTGGPDLAAAKGTGYFYIYMDGSDDVIIEGNHFYMSSGGGSARQGIFGGTTYTPCQSTIISGNTFTGIHEHAIYFYGDYVNIINNVISYCQTYSDQLGNAIKVLGNGFNVSGNRIYNSAKGGINLFNGSYNSATNNTIYNFGQTGIYIGDQVANANGDNYDIISGNTLIAATDGRPVYQGIVVAGDATLSTSDFKGIKVFDNIIINAGSSSAITLGAMAFYHSNSSYKLVGLDVHDNEVFNYKSKAGIYLTRCTSGSFHNNLIKDSNQSNSIGFYLYRYNTNNTFEFNTIRDDQATPTLYAGLYYDGTTNIDNRSVGNIFYSMLDTQSNNIWSQNARYRNLADKNIIEDLGNYPLVLNTKEASADIEGDTSTTIPLNIPANVKLLGVQLRVDSALASGETWNASFIGGSTTSISSNTAVAKNTKINKLFAGEITSGITNINITKNGGGNFTAQGTIKALVYYESLTTLKDLP